jgi:hypothetical protein
MSRRSPLRGRRGANHAGQALHRAIIRDVARLKSYPGVRSVALGHKEKGGKLTRRVSVKIYVEKKKPASKVGKEQLPRTAVVLWPVDRLHYRARRIITDVVEVKRFSLAVSPCEYFPRVPVGAQIGCGGIVPTGPGTQGCVVRRAADNATLLMTAAHVVAANPGPVAPNTPVFQPDGPIPRFSVGRTIGGFFGNIPQLGVYVDTALYEVTNTQRSAANTSWNQQMPPVRGSLSLAEICQARLPVEKTGAATGYTMGQFSTFHREYPDPDLGHLLQVLEYVSVSPNLPLADHGDSGAVVVSAAPSSRGAVIGLLFAVSSDGQSAFVVPFDSIRAAFHVEVA